MNDRVVELRPNADDAPILLHQAAKGQKAGQSLIKLAFDIQDVQVVRNHAATHGLQFGPVHSVDGSEFANAKDPAGNPVQISSRAFFGAG